MKHALFFTFCILSLSSAGQKIVFPTNDKETIVYLKAGWCQVCRAWEAEFEKDPVSQLIVTRFNWFPLRAEEQADILFQGKTYSFEPTGYKQGQHALVNLFLNDENPVFPTFIFLDASGKVLKTVQGAIPLSLLYLLVSEKPEE